MDFNTELNRVLRYSTKDAVILRQQLATDPEHLKAGSTLRGIAADATEEGGDKDFADYLRSKYPLATKKDAKGQPYDVIRSSLRLHRLLTTLHGLYHSATPGRGELRQNHPINAEAVTELEHLGRNHEADILRTAEPTTYKNGVVRGDHPSHAWPEGVPMIYHAGDGGVLCPECRNGGNGSLAMTEDDPQWQVTGHSLHWEGPPIHCDHCNASIESAYGDPDAEDDQ